MSDQKPQIPLASPVMPAALNEGTEIKFRCYKGISCFNACCKQADVTLAPYDVIRLKDRLGMTSTDFLAQYTVPFEMDGDGLPGIKLKTTDEGTCLLLAGDEGCGVYSDRPTVCRYYPVALLQIRHKEGVGTHQNYSLITEDHCSPERELPQDLCPPRGVLRRGRGQRPGSAALRLPLPAPGPLRRAQCRRGRQCLGEAHGGA